MKVTIVQHNGHDGVKCIENGETDMSALCGPIRRRRASHIWPDHPIKFVAFLLLRRAFGDKGRVASWTRRWRGPWRVIIIATGETRIFRRRINCVMWEEQRINALLMNLNQQP